VDVMGVDVSTSKKDTVAEEGEPAAGSFGNSKGRGRLKGLVRIDRVSLNQARSIIKLVFDSQPSSQSSCSAVA